MYPQLLINKKKFSYNLDTTLDLCQKYNITLMAVTKVFCAEQELIEIINASNTDFIADSRIENLKSMSTNKQKVLLRIPSVHELYDVIKYVDISLNSELEVIRKLNKVAEQHNVKHKIILMIDIGDLREGIYYKEDILKTIQAIKSLESIQLEGIGTNLTCYGGIIPNLSTLNKLVEVIKLSKSILNIDFKIISGGNSSHLHLLKDGYNIPYINNLRVGEAIVLGRETAFGESIQDLYQDVFVLASDLIEVQFKPSIPEGDIGMNAFGQVPEFQDHGIIKRGIIALGKQDVDYHEIMPYDSKIRFIGSSSDHIIIDLTHSDKDYQVGDVIKFKLSYGSLLSLMTSKYVKKVYYE